MKRLSSSNRGMYADRVWIIDPGKLPPKYFLRPAVLKAIRKEVLNDIRTGKVKRVPGGTQARLIRKPLWRHVWGMIRGQK